MSSWFSAAFIDPFFSSGVHLAMTGGLAAATSIAASIRGECPEQEAAEWHTHRVSISYTRSAPRVIYFDTKRRWISVLIMLQSRFLLVVLSVYKQIRAEPFDVLSDVTEENFDKAFDFIRPGALCATLPLTFSSLASSLVLPTVT